MKFDQLLKLCLESSEPTLTLYVGCDAEKASHLMDNGWSPSTNRDWSMSKHGGQGRYLYLTNDPENASWYGDIVLQVQVPIPYLMVDPEDGVADTVEQELNNKMDLPGNVVCFRDLSKSAFTPI